MPKQNDKIIEKIVEEKSVETDLNKSPEISSVNNQEKKESATSDKIKANIEQIEVKSKDLLNKIKELLHEGNIRRIKIKKADKVVMEIPLSVATVGVILAPVAASIGALAAIFTECTIEVERAE